METGTSNMSASDASTSSQKLHCDVTIVMAYSDDYTIGKLCESVNREYAAKFHHPFFSSVLPGEDILKVIHPKKHITWYKIYLLRDLMRKAMMEQGYSEEDLDRICRRADEQHDKYDKTKRSKTSQITAGSIPREQETDLRDVQSNLLGNDLSVNAPINSCSSSIQYLFWIDGDAMVCYQDLSLDELLEEAQYKDLVIAEDMHKHNPINAGVFLLRVNEWSLEFLESTWINKRYDTTFYYEQSAMIKALRYRKQGMLYLNPFHSFDGGPQGVKFFPNVAVFPLKLFSSNELMTAEESEIIVKEFEDKLSILSTDRLAVPAATLCVESKESPTRQTASIETCEEHVKTRPLFIFHAAGMRSKLNILKAIIIKYNLPCPLIGGDDWMDMKFKLMRNTLGHVITQYSTQKKTPNDVSQSDA